jgi:anti-anti-sigma factor
MRMAAKTLEAGVRQINGVTIMDLRGEINGFAENALNAAYVEAAEHQPSAIVLNFSDVDYINSTGIALIVGILAQARKTGQRVLTYGLSEHYLEIFQITRLADFMKIFPDESSAVASVAAARA